MVQGIPEDVGCSSARLQRIDKVMQSYVDRHRLAGLITMVARHGKIVHFAPFGVMDLEANTPMQRDSLFVIASMTKLITCAAALMLYEEGYFQLNDPISEFIPAFKDLKVFVKMADTGFEVTDLDRPVTIHDLMTHTSGLSYGFWDDSPVEEMYRQANLERPGTTLEDLVQRLAQLPLIHQPGSAWRYGYSHDVLARMIEIITGQPYNDFLRQRMFTPLGMQDTDFTVPSEKLSRLVTPYRIDDTGNLERIPAAEWDDFSSSPPPFGGQGLVSTGSDYMRFAQMLLNGGELDGVQLLGRKTVELMTMNHLPKELLPFNIVRLSKGYYSKGYGYGLGVRVMIDVAQNEIVGSLGSYGWAGGANTFVWIDPKEGLIGLLLTQLTPLYYYPIEREFMTLVYQALTGRFGTH
jgi:CubicO group peptidase (beta-lactamase class C family)